MLRSPENNEPDAHDCNAVSTGALADGVAAGSTAFLSLALVKQFPDITPWPNCAFRQPPQPVVPNCANLPLGAVRPAPDGWIERLNVTLGKPRLSPTLSPPFTIAAPDRGSSASRTERHGRMARAGGMGALPQGRKVRYANG